MEDKVEELEKISQSSDKEKEALRAQVDKMTIQLNEFRKRLSLLSGGRPSNQGPAAPFGNLFVNNLNDVNFQFEFPKFGSLPGPPTTNGAKKPSPAVKQNGTGYQSPSEHSQDGVSPTNSSNYNRNGSDAHRNGGVTSFSPELFTPPPSNGTTAGGSATAGDSPYNQNYPTATSSPSASSNSNMGCTSSCGTSPEPYTQSPLGFKPIDTLATIGEEQPSFNNTTQGEKRTRA